jgi:(1->4)-alpha-D-glucan 1-alpha-D-glucosylmutase
MTRGDPRTLIRRSGGTRLQRAPPLSAGCRGATPASPASAPVSTYRLQLQPGFGFSAAAASADYLAGLGVTHVYLSPILQATPGSTHGYDVVDHTLVSEELGGEAAFRAMAGRFRDLGLGVIVDIVPNHMAVPVPESLNRPLWLVLRDGPGSPFAAWFDVDWAAQDVTADAVLWPGQRLPRGPETGQSRP